MKKPYLALVAMAFILAVQLPVSAQDAVLLRFAPKAGDEWVAVESHELKITMDLKDDGMFSEFVKSSGGLPGAREPGKLEISQDRSLLYALHVLTTAEDQTTLGLTFLAVRAKKQTPLPFLNFAMASTFDSTDPLALPSMDMLGEALIIGADFRMVVSNRYELLRLEGLAEFGQEIGKRLNWGEAQERAFAEAVKSENLNEAAPGMGRPCLYPASAVRIGDQWTSESRETIQGTEVVCLNTYTLRSRRDGVAVVDVQSTIKAAGRNGELRSGLDLTGEQTGSIEILEETGWPIKAEIDQNLRMAGENEADEAEEPAISGVLQGKYVLTMTRRTK